TWINFSYQGAIALTALMFVILFAFFFKIDREMPVVTKALTDRKKAECEALGIPYVSPQEQQRAEIMEQQKEAEENRVKELREKCEKKGLDFEEENRKYLEKQAKKKARKAKLKGKES
ncbi:MAG: MFS transporter, partial [Lachnospiraceae bacterium]|nr:MFS transporter [Lachnospiraceae bacterium]